MNGVCYSHGDCEADAAEATSRELRSKVHTRPNCNTRWAGLGGGGRTHYSPHPRELIELIQFPT